MPNILQAFRTGHPADIMRLSLGALLTLPYLAANVSGGWLFAPGYERIYRAVGYFIIAVSALNGLPLFVD
ncbi:MAG: hypothetical protein L3J30_14535 [Marinosulfonomonas sp.]|nr:hypothetical protein [Marinosulfonomonas sp.]